MDIPTLRLDCVTDPRLREVAAVWMAARGERLAPPVSAVGLERFEDIADGLWMCDVVEGDPAGRFRYRHAGATIRQSYGRDITGETIEQITEDVARARVVGYFSAAVDRPALVHVKGRLFAENRTAMIGERLMLPLFAEDEDRAVRILGVTLHTLAAQPGQPVPPPMPRQVRTHIPLDGSRHWAEILA